MNGVIAERHIADHRIEVVIRQRRILEALGKDGGIRIELARDARGDGVELDAGAVAAGKKFAGHQPQEVAYAHRGLQNLGAFRDS